MFLKQDKLGWWEKNKMQNRTGTGQQEDERAILR